MANSKRSNGNQVPFDNETGELIPPGSGEDVTVDQLYGDGTGGPEGSVTIPKITAASIRSMPERAKIADRPVKMFLITGIAGSEYLMPRMGDEARLEGLDENNPERMTFTALVAALEPWGAVRYDNDGEPDAVFKSDYLFLPVGHIATLQKQRQYGQYAFALEFWAQPAGNVRGYSWYVNNLAKYDHNMSFIDRLMKLGVNAGRQLEVEKNNVGLLADLRAR